jgi:hypothetical protein
MRIWFVLALASSALAQITPSGGSAVTIVNSLPATCPLGRLYEYGNNFYGCAPANTLSVFQSSSSGVSSVVGTTQQVTASTTSGTVTISLPTNLLFPGTPTFTASTTGGASFNLPSGVAPTSPNTGDVWNLSGVLQYYAGATRSLLYSGGPLGTPSSGTLTNATGLPISGITGLGTGVATWLGTPTLANLNTVVSQTLLYSGGALGTPSSATLTHATGLPIAGITGLGTGVGTWLGTPTLANLNTVVSQTLLYSGGALGTPSSGTATNLLGLPAGGLAAISADNIFGNFTAASAIPTTQAIPACANDGSHALVYASHTLTCESIVAGSMTFSGTQTTNAIVTSTATANTFQNGSSPATIDSSGNISTPGSISSGVSSGVAGALECQQGTAATAASNAFGWTCPTTMTTSVLLQSPNATPSANTVMLFGTTVSNVTPWTYTGFTSTNLTDTGNLVYNNAANAFTAAGSINLNASTVANALRAPAKSSFTCSATGCLGEDTASSTNNYHIYAGADAIIIPALVTALPSNGDAVKVVVNGSNLTLADAGGAPVVGSAYQTVDANATSYTQRPTLNLISGSNATVACVDNSGASRTDCTISASSSAGSALNQISAATGTNTINSGNYAQIWQWLITSSGETAFTFTEPSASSASGTDYLIGINTLAGSTVNPLVVTGGGTSNGVYVNTAGLLQKIGTGSILANNIAGGATSDIVIQSGAGTTSFVTPVDNAVLVTSASGVPSEAAASSPLTVSSSALGCPTCVTSAASLTNNAPVIGGGSQATSTISVVDGSTLITNSSGVPSESITPTLGVPGTSTGTWTFGNATGSGTFTLGASPSTTSNTMLGPTAVPTTGDLLSCTTSSTVCTLTDAGVLAANVNTNSSNFTSGHLVEASGNHTTEDGGIAVSTLVTSASSLTANALMTGAGSQGAQTVTTGSGVVSFLGTPSAANFNTMMTGPVGPATGGTGVANGSSNTITFTGNYTLGLTLTGATSVTLPTSGTLVNSAVATLSSLTSVGTIGTGTWQGTQVAVAYGGTNCTSASITCFNNITGYSAAGTTGTTSTNLVFSTSPTLVTPALGAATATSLLATGIVDGEAPVTITTGTTANLGAAYNSGYTFNQEGTAGTGVTYTLPATATGKQYCVQNSGTTSVVNAGILTVYPPSGSYMILNGVVNTVGGGGTHGVASGGAAGDSACFVAIDSTHWEVFVGKGTWAEN